MESQSFTRQELYNLVWSEPMLKIAQKYLISDAGLRLICIKHEIPFPRAGHWMKIKFGKQIDQPKLPATNNTDQLISLSIRSEELIIIKGEPTQEKLKKHLIEKELAGIISVPERLSRPEKIITLTKDNLTRKNAWLHNGLVVSEIDLVRITVSKSNIARAIRFMDTLVKSLKARGHGYEIRSQENFITIKGQSFEVSLREKTMQHPSKDKWTKFDYLPTGLLALKTGRFHRTREWSDGKQPLENQIAAILVWLEEKADELIAQEKEWEIKRKLREAEELKAKQLQERKDKELSDFRDIISKSSRWQKSEELRAYIKAVESKAIADNKLTEKLIQRLDWLRDKADWYDPFVEKEDPLLENIDRDTLLPKKKEWSYN